MIKKLYLALILSGACAAANPPPLGLPPVPIPDNNLQTPEKIQLGDKLFHDARFSADGKVSCATCHAQDKGFTDNLPVSVGFKGLTGTRNAPTVINSAYLKTLFWDGREPDLEGQSKQPPINPVEGGLANHAVLVEVIRKDPDYVSAFKAVFGVDKNGISIDHVAMAIASFERTVIAGDSPFDHYLYGGETDAMSQQQIRGLALFTGKARCVSCHRIEQTQALFTDNRFHNIGIGFKSIQGKEQQTASAFIKSKREGADVDVTVLTQKTMSELGRFVVTENVTQVGAFKTPTLRNIDLTAPYMHDGSIETLTEVIDFYSNGGRVKTSDPLSGFLSGGIKPLELSEVDKQDLLEFMKALTSPNLDQYTTRH
jgi:cytochrome c peroxidase